jgi:hypothetical protein
MHPTASIITLANQNKWSTLIGQSIYGRIKETEEWRKGIPRMGVITLFIDPAMLYTTLIPFTADRSASHMSLNYLGRGWW